MKNAHAYSWILVVTAAISLNYTSAKEPDLTQTAPETLSAEKMWSLGRLSDAVISPNGEIAVVSVTQYDAQSNATLTDLWRIPVAGGAAEPLTSDPAAEKNPRFSPNGRYLAFVAQRDDDEAPQLYVLPMTGGEARRLTDIPTGVEAPRWFNDGDRIAFVSSIWPDLVRWEDQAARLEERKEPKMTARVWDKAPISYWDHFLDDRQPHIFWTDLNGREPTAVTRLSGFHLPKTSYSDTSYDISPDGDEITFVADVDLSGVDPNLDLIATASCGCKPAVRLTADNPADDDTPRYSPDGRWLAYSAQSLKGFYADRRRLKLHSRTLNRDSIDLSLDWDRSVGEPIWRADSTALFSTIDDAATQRVYRFDLQRPGKPAPITQQSSFGSLSIAKIPGPAPTAVALRQSFSEPPTLVRLDLRSGRSEALSSFNDAALSTVKMGAVESVNYAGSGEHPVQMWVIYPPGFDPQKKYPLFLLLHGGPHNAIQDAVQWRWNAQVFASWGYVVAWHNFHGSSGFGQSFADSINPDWVSKPYEDTLRAAQYFAAKDFIDPERMVAGGGSYGGFLASTLLGRPHPFKALIAHAAVYNLYTQIGADYGGEKARFFEFWQRPQEFARYSPHTQAANFNTPTLVIHGQNDLRVPVNHGFELFNTLQKRGVESKLIYYPDENHWILSPQNSIFWYQTVRDWIERFAPPEVP
jgi:dipeptidyl aminopeptidase/acylaminoacyl peptidase